MEAGIVACYPFDGDTDDASVNGHHAVGDGISFVPGQRGMALLHSEKSVVTVENDAMFAPEQITVEAWLMLEPFMPSGMAVIDHDSHWAILVRGGFWECARRNEESVRSSDQAETGRWVHVACVLGDNVHVLYVDGEQVASLPATTLSTVPSSSPIHIGSNGPQPIEPLIGAIDDLRIFDFARKPVSR